jgi:hypothetical protein
VRPFAPRRGAAVRAGTGAAIAFSSSSPSSRATFGRAVGRVPRVGLSAAAVARRWSSGRVRFFELRRVQFCWLGLRSKRRLAAAFVVVDEAYLVWSRALSCFLTSPPSISSSRELEIRE